MKDKSIQPRESSFTFIDRYDKNRNYRVMTQIFPELTEKIKKDMASYTKFQIWAECGILEINSNIQ